MKREWVLSIHRQCSQQIVPFFFKQWGGVRKSKAGRLLDGRTYDEMPADAVQPAISHSSWTDAAPGR
jgi:protein gp37